MREWLHFTIVSHPTWLNSQAVGDTATTQWEPERVIRSVFYRPKSLSHPVI